MNLSEFIRNNLEVILQKWDLFAYSIQPNLDKKSLRDHAEYLIKDIADDLDISQGKHEQAKKSQSHNLNTARTSAAGKHGLERFKSGFIITDIIAEYRFLRVTVIRLLNDQKLSDAVDNDDLIRFNEVLDQQMFEAAANFHIEREKQIRQFDTVLSSTSDNNYILDLNCKFIYANKPMLQFLNLPLNELIGKTHFELSCPAAAEVHNAVKKVIETTEKRSGEVGYILPSGEERSFEFVYTPVFNNEDKIESVAAAERDITDRKLFAEKLRKSEEELLILNDELEQRVERRTHELEKAQSQYLHAVKLSAIGQLTASIAHEFNNPLQGLRTILKGLKRRAIMEKEDRELLDLAISENERIKKLIISLQEFNRPSAGQKVKMDVHSAFDSLLLLYKSEFKRKKISAVRKYAEGFPPILVIPDQLKQVFLNLLNNATDACSEKGGVITITTCHDDQKVAITIQDTGVGFEHDKKNKIFEPFFTTKTKEKGTGLGLSICQDIIKHHQGEILVESSPGKGSTFTILLPAVQKVDTL